MARGSQRLILILLFTGLVIVLVNLAWWIFYQRTAEMLADQLERRLVVTTEAARLLIAERNLDALTNDDFDSYLDLYGQLEWLRASDSLSELFLLAEDYSYLLTTLTTGDSVYFLADIHRPLIDSFWFGLIDDAVIVSRSYETGGVILRSAFAPVYDTVGLTAAVVGVEASVDYFDDLGRLRTNLYAATGLSVVAGLILALIFFWLQRRINAAEQVAFLGETHAYLGRMVAVVAHELKNPLMIMRASAERLKRKTEQPEADYLLEEVDRLNDLVSGYLSFAKAEGSYLAGETPSQFDLIDLLRALRTGLAERVVPTTVDWTNDLPEQPMVVAGYRRALRQVILNLLINAAEASSGKTIVLGLDCERTGDRVAIRIRDHGHGMTPQQVRDAFEPFVTSKTTGSGLGLFLTKKIVEEIGGTIDLSSQPQRGTEVTVTIPSRV